MLKNGGAESKVRVCYVWFYFLFFLCVGEALVGIEKACFIALSPKLVV